MARGSPQPVATQIQQGVQRGDWVWNAALMRAGVYRMVVAVGKIEPEYYQACDFTRFCLVQPQGIGVTGSRIVFVSHQHPKEIPLAKAPAKKPVAKKAPAKKAAAKAPAAKAQPIKEALTKSALVNMIVEQNGLTRAVAQGVLATIEGAMTGSIHPKGVGEFTELDCPTKF